VSRHVSVSLPRYPEVANQDRTRLVCALSSSQSSPPPNTRRADATNNGSWSPSGRQHSGIPSASLVPDHESAEMYMTVSDVSRGEHDGVALRHTIVSSYECISVRSPLDTVHVLLRLFKGDVHVAVNRLQLAWNTGEFQEVVTVAGGDVIPL